MYRIPNTILIAALGAMALFAQSSAAEATKGKAKKAPPPNPVNPVCAQNWKNEGGTNGHKQGSFASVDLYVFGKHQDGVAILDAGKLIACDQIADQQLEVQLTSKIAAVVYGQHHDEATVYGRDPKGRVIICDYPSLDHHIRIGSMNDYDVIFTEIGLNRDLSRLICLKDSVFYKSKVDGGPKVCERRVPLAKDVGKDGDNERSPRLIAGRA